MTRHLYVVLLFILALTGIATAQDAGIVVSKGALGISFSQNFSSELLKDTYSHEVGNISVYFSW